MEKVDKKIKNKNFITKLMEIGKIMAEKCVDAYYSLATSHDMVMHFGKTALRSSQLGKAA